MINTIDLFHPQCPWCHSSYYCSDEHQAVHRPGTKCFPLKVGQVEVRMMMMMMKMISMIMMMAG